MKKYLWPYLTACLVSVGVVGAKAGLYLDPYLGYGMGEFKLESSLGTNESDTDSMVAGLRVGYSKLGFFIGPDFMFHVQSDFKPSLADPNLPINSAVGRNGDGVQGAIYLTAGLKIPILPFRVYAGYPVFNTYEIDFDDGSDVEFKGSGGYKLGVGYKPGVAFIRLPISLNLEYMVSEFDEASGVGRLGGTSADFPFVTGDAPDLVTYNDAEIETIMLSLSIPFTLFK